MAFFNAVGRVTSGILIWLMAVGTGYLLAQPNSNYDYNLAFVGLGILSFIAILSLVFLFDEKEER